MTDRPHRASALLATLAITVVAACGGDGPRTPSSDERVLANGIGVRLFDDGRVELFDDRGDEERVLWSTGDARPTLRSFDESFEGPLAIWTFRRSGTEETALEDVAAIEQAAGAVTVFYGEDPEAPIASLTFRPGIRLDTTELVFEAEGETPSAFALPIACDEEGTFHGFGEQYNATDQRGEAFSVIVSEQGVGRAPGSARSISGDAHTTYFPMPYYLDARGHGMLVRTDHRVEADICSSDPATAWLEVVGDESLEAVVFHGPTALEVVRQLGDEVGRPRRPPDWAFSPWVSIQGGRDAVLAEADLLEAEGIPVSALWSQDWTGTRMNIDGGFGVQYRWVEDTELYPDLAGMIDELHGRGLRFLAYANPFVDEGLTDHWPEMAAEDLLVRDETMAPYAFDAPNGASGHPDFTKPEAEEYVEAALSDMVTRLGIDGWMADFGEWTPLDAQLSDGSDPHAFHNRFPVEWHRVNREAMDGARPDGDYVLFARSGWSGVQRHAMIHWVGDQEADFGEHDGLPTVVPAMINLGLAGVPYVTHDIAGFSSGPSTKELYWRWVELGAFTPVMRTHEGNNRTENWNWKSDAETIAHFGRFARIHEALVPDLLELADEAARTSAPIVRHMMLAYPEDPMTFGISDAYMLGDTLLVAPITTEGATSREVYFPEGEWFHVMTGERFTGPGRFDVEAPLGTPPVFSSGVDRTDLRAIE